VYKLVATATSLRVSENSLQTHFRSFIYRHSFTNPVNLATMDPVDVQIIGRTKSLKNKQINKKQRHGRATKWRCPACVVFLWPVCCFHVSMLLVTKNVILILAEFKFYNSLLFLLRGILTMRKIRIPVP